MANVYRGDTGTNLATAVQSSPAFSATQLMQRTVWDMIALNFAQNVKLLAMVDQGTIDDSGVNRKPGMIAKHVVDSKRYECFNYTPRHKSCVVTSSNGSTALVVDDTSQLKVYDTLYNPATGESCRIDAVTNTTTLVVTIIGATFQASAGDVLMYGPTAYPENSSSPSILSKDFDNVYNTLQISREPVAISNSMLKSKFLAGGDYFKMLKGINMVEFLRKIERGWMFGNRATGTGNTTAGGSALTASFSTTQGLAQTAATTYDMKGTMTPFKIRKDVPQQLTTVSETEKVIMLFGYEVQGRINEMFNDKVQYFVDSNNTPLSKMGVQTKTLVTMNMPIEIVRHEAMEIGELAHQAYIFCPDKTRFANLKDRDIRPVVGIQNNDVDGVIDSIEAEYGFETIDGGQSILKVTNCW